MHFRLLGRHILCVCVLQQDCFSCAHFDERLYGGDVRPCVCSGEQMGVGMLVYDVNGDPTQGESPSQQS